MLHLMVFSSSDISMFFSCVRETS